MIAETFAPLNENEAGLNSRPPAADRIRHEREALTELAFQFAQILAEVLAIALLIFHMLLGCLDGLDALFGPFEHGVHRGNR